MIASASATRAQAVGSAAEHKVLAALEKLPAPWQVFNTVEWRLPGDHGEVTGEADIVVFHPQQGLVVIEIKAGQVEIRDGQWYYASGRPMKQSPFSQARRNRYALAEKLERRLGKTAFDSLTITHAAWLPDVRWTNAVTILEVPTPDFILDHAALADPEPRLLRLFRAAAPTPQPWARPQQQALKDLLAPDCRLLTPLAARLDDAVSAMHRATEEQMAVLRMLRTQKRLLIEGGAGTGKTLLAVSLAREHAALGRRVLFTCYNKALAQQIATAVADIPAIRVQHFHDLVARCARDAGLDYQVPKDPAVRVGFFRDDCPELLMQAAERMAERYETLIVDEAADFMATWWLALEELGDPDFRWYCFYDRHQTIFTHQQDWSPPFPGEPMPLETNLRNTRPVGELAARLGQCPVPTFQVESGQQPVITGYADFEGMAVGLRDLLHQLIQREAVTPERIAVLAPYKPSNPQSRWAEGLREIAIHDDLATVVPGKVRAGTIHGFKGLEADVVILAGLTRHAMEQRELLYVGASRAKAALYILTLAALPLGDQQPEAVPQG